jgi:hypothetical protein
LKLFRALVVALVATALVVGGVPAQDPPVAASMMVTELHMQEAAGGWESQVIDTPTTMLGLTWDEQAPLSAWYRVKREGRWFPWLPLPVEDDHGPDIATDEGRRSRAGSDPVWVGASQAVQFRTLGEGSRRTQAVLIDTKDLRRPLHHKVADFLTPRTPGASGTPSQPFIHARAEWDPTNSCEPRVESDFGQITHMFVHHTTATNSYSQADVPGMILAICKFHRDSRDWNDIAYNFIIDKYGRIWEGRAGGIDKGVQGAHTQGFSSYSVGVAFLGTHETSGPSASAEAALVRLLAWKAAIHNVDTLNPNMVVSKGSNKWPQGTPVTLRPISGHSDAQTTSCPGEACYNRLGTFRNLVNDQWRQVPISTYVSPLIGDFDGDSADEAAVFRTTNGHWLVSQPGGGTTTWADFSTANGWSSRVVGDFNGDGRDDIANYHPSNGTWWVSRSTGSGFSTTLWADFATASGWSTRVVGDFNGDGRDDIANYHPSNGTWWVSRSTGSGFATSLWADFATARGWSSQVVGDFDGDGRDDIANFHPSNGTWWVSRSTGSGFSTTLWADFSTASGWTIQLPGDYDGDGRDDIANRHVGNGTWWVVKSTGDEFANAALWGTTASYDHLSHSWTQDVDANGRDDILSIDAYTGFIRRHVSSGSAFAIGSIADTPWRTTVGGASRERETGSNGWLYFGQEFQWVRLSGLNSSRAGTDIVVTLPRP